MTGLKKALPTTQNTAKLQASLTKMLGAGRETKSGTAIIRSAVTLVDHTGTIAKVKEQASFLKFLMRAKKPKKCYADKMRREEVEDPKFKGRSEIKYYRQYHWEIPATTAEEKNIIEQNLLACPKDRIIDLITRYLEVHKKHIVNDPAKRQVLYQDMASILYGYPEYALTLGILDIVADPKQVWFPVVGQIVEATEKHLLPWPDSIEAGEELHR